MSKQSFRYFVAAAVALLVAVVVSAREYIYPVLNIKRQYTASYGEMRSNHFHSGVDIRTDQVEGKSVVAVADGFVSRVAYVPRGFGYVLYVTHPNKGTMSVYAHLSRLRSDIAKYLTDARYASKSNNKNLYPPKELFPVRQGDVIAYSGNSGSSSGPHVHFEMRDLVSGFTRNPVRMGVITPTDTIAPRILRLRYIVVDTLEGCSKSRILGSYTPKLINGVYRIDEEVTAGGRGYFVLEVVDNRNNSSNRFGIYRATMSINGERKFEYRIDKFSFSDTKLCNFVSYPPLQRGARHEVLRLARIHPAPKYLYPNSPTNGVIHLAEGAKASVEVAVEDECGNISKLLFSAQGAKYQRNSYPVSTAESRLLTGGKEQIVRGEGFRMVVPGDALYEPEYCNTKVVEAKQIKDSTLVQLSQFYCIFADDVATNKAVKVAIAAKVPAQYQRHVAVAAVSAKGGAWSLGGKYRNDSVEVSMRRGGNIVVVADTIAPQIRPLFKSGADMRKGGELRFSVKDNFSGISSYSLLIDEEWRTLDFHPIKRELVHRFDRALKGSGVSHNVVLKVADGCGNTAVWRGKILK